jgi:hypothetical protein
MGLMQILILIRLTYLLKVVTLHCMKSAMALGAQCLQVTPVVGAALSQLPFMMYEFSRVQPTFSLAQLAEWIC